MQNRHAEKEGRRHNSTDTQVGLSCFYDTFVVNQSEVLRLNFCAKKPHLRVAAKRQTV